MAGLDAVHSVGESIALLLQRRRGLLAAENRLGPVPAGETIQHIGLGALVATPPSSGLSISCYHIAYSDNAPSRRPSLDAATHGMSLELSYFMASWSALAAADMAQLSWAMLELNRFPVLDRALLANTESWARDETLQIVPENPAPEQIFRLWESLKLKHRLAALFKVRVLRIGYGPIADNAPVVASRLSFMQADPLAEMVAG
jgi:Pvc16 N-terminal domain